jgi:Ca2+-binding RTX toxin-like protein
VERRVRIFWPYGHDTYTFDLASDTGLVTLIDDATQGLDGLVINGLTEDHFISGAFLTAGGVDYIDLIFSELTGFDEFEDPLFDEVLRVRFSETDIEAGAGLEHIKLGSDMYAVDDIVTWIDEHTSDDPFSILALSQDIYGYTGGSGGTGAGGGMLPGAASGGQFSSMQVSPLTGGRWLPVAYAEEILHPFVVTAMSSEPEFSGGQVVGHDTSITIETYLQEAVFRHGITMDDVRFAASGTLGDAGLLITIDSLDFSVVLDDFETGREIDGFAFYGQDLHEMIQGTTSGTLTGSGNGHYQGEYSSTYEIDPVTGTLHVTYFLETISFASGGSIDMTDALTLRGTDDGESIAGFDTRDDILEGLGGIDTLQGYGGDDVLIGGAGADGLYGNLGDDTYQFAVGFGVATTAGLDYALENVDEGTDTVAFVGGILPADVRSWVDGLGDLHFRLAGDPDDEVYFEGNLETAGADINSRIERVVFDGGTVWDLTQGLLLTDTDDVHTIYGSAQDDVIDGRDGNDYLYSQNGDDVLIGGAGADSANGGLGDDTYQFAAGFGVATTYGLDYALENVDEGTDTVTFVGGIVPADVRSWVDGLGALHFRLAGDTDDEVYFEGNLETAGADINSRIERVVFDGGTVWDLTQGLPLTDTDDAHVSYGSAQDDVIDGRGGNDSLYGKDGNDVLIGGAGYDI